MARDSGRRSCDNALEALETEYEIASRSYDRALSAFYHTFDLVNIALILANALLGFMFLATEDAGIHRMVSIVRAIDYHIQPWLGYPLIASVALLLIAISCLAYVTLRRPTFEGRDDLTNSGLNPNRPY